MIDLIHRLGFFLSPQGLNLLKRANALKEEVQRLEAAGLCKIEAAVTGSEVEGFYGLLKGAASHTSLSSIPPLPRNLVLPQPPLPLNHPFRSPVESHLKYLFLWAEEKEQTPEAPMKLALEAPSLVAPEAPEEAIPAHMTPLCLQLGVSRRCTSAGLRVARRGH